MTTYALTARRSVTVLAGPAPAPLAALADTLLRAGAGLFLVPHGAQKLFGWFGGGGLAATAEFFESGLGFSNGMLAAIAAGGLETFGGLMLALGIATRPVAAVLALFLLVAASVHLPAGFFWSDGGWEYPVLWAIVMASFAIRGGSPLSLDAALARR